MTSFQGNRKAARTEAASLRAIPGNTVYDYLMKCAAAEIAKSTSDIKNIIVNMSITSWRWESHPLIPYAQANRRADYQPEE